MFFFQPLMQFLGQSALTMQAALTALALAVASLVSALLQRLSKRYISRYVAEQSVGKLLLKTALRLLLPFLAIILLGVAHSMAETMNVDNRWIDKAAIACLAWMLIRLVLVVGQGHFIARFVAGLIFVMAALATGHMLHKTIIFLDQWAFELGSFRLSLLIAVKGIIVCILLLWLAGALTRLVEDTMTRAVALEFSTRELIRKFAKISIYFIALMLLLNVMGVDLTALTVFGGALGVGLGFGLQKITSNFVSGIILLLERTLRIGDLVQVGGEKGNVKYLGIRHTLIETSDGREVMVPNEELILTRVTSWTYSSTAAAPRKRDCACGIQMSALRVQEILLLAAKECTSA